MKKFLSLVLALVMVMSLSVTAFAESGTTTLTANIPNAAEPSFTLHIPADTTLTYGNTDWQQLSGVLDATDIQNANLIRCTISFTDLINTSDPSDSIGLIFNSTVIEENSGDTFEQNFNNGTTLTLYTASWGYDYKLTLFAKVADWSGATPGATYQAVLTFTATAE